MQLDYYCYKNVEGGRVDRNPGEKETGGVRGRKGVKQDYQRSRNWEKVRKVLLIIEIEKNRWEPPGKGVLLGTGSKGYRRCEV